MLQWIINNNNNNNNVTNIIIITLLGIVLYFAGKNGGFGVLKLIKIILLAH